MRKEITEIEREEFKKLWSDQREAIKASASAELLQIFDTLTTSTNVGSGYNQIRPGEPGRWDMYYYLILYPHNIPKEQSLLVAGLTAQQVHEHEEEVRNRHERKLRASMRKILPFAYLKD